MENQGMSGEIKLGSINVGDHNADWFRVMAKLSGRSVRANTASVIAFYVQRQQAKYERMLKHTSRKYGLTPDECFRRLLNDEDLGEPMKDFSEDAPLIEIDEES